MCIIKFQEWIAIITEEDKEKLRIYFICGIFLEILSVSLAELNYLQFIAFFLSYVYLYNNILG